MIIDKKDFQEIGKKLQEYETNRDLVIKKSRDIIKISKQIIYSVHRNELNEELIKKIKQEKTKLEKDLKKYPGLYFEGSFKVAIQEYVEALLYFYFVKNKKIATMKELSVDFKYYLLGLCDLTGELFRRAIHSATNNKTKEVFQIKNTVEEIYGTMLKFDIS